MARTSVQDVSSIPDPALVWNFDLMLPSIPGSSDTRQLTYRCMTQTLPGSELDSVAIKLHGIELRRRGARNWSHTMTTEFMEAVDWNTRNQFFAWMESAQSWVNNTGSPSSVYLVNGQIILYTDAPAVAKTVLVRNMWPQAIQDVNLDGGNGAGMVQLGITWSYDWTEDM